jgi:ubiquinone/menaquinone biosynthesis C-methylase UbiE
LGTDRHAMRYVACGAENLPFPEHAFDIVCAFNSLDHVDNLDQAIGAIKRVVTPQGFFLLLTDTHRHPTVLEPTAFSWEVIAKFKPEFEVMEQKQFEYTAFSPEGYGDMYQSLRHGILYHTEDTRERNGILSARFRKLSRDFYLPVS